MSHHLFVSLLVGISLLAPVLAHAQRGGATLPEGPGREVVQGMCSVCHGVNMITGAAGYSAEGWQNLIGTMVRLPDPMRSTVVAYLAKNFPEKPGRRPTLVSGPVNVTFKEWIVPTLGQRARDPLQTPDGMIWWTGQFGSLVGRLNPTTGEMKEFKLTPDARPHSITADRAGDIWYSGNGNGTIGKITAKTGTIEVFPLPNPAARDPHTLLFDQQGRLWFTVQGGNMVGRLVPATGDIKLVTMPTAGARPYGIKINSKGVPWVAYNGSNKLASLDPETMAVREYPMPSPETRIRRLALASDDVVWYVDSARGRLGRFDPRTGRQKDWPSPSGPLSHPYAIAVLNDVVWYNESNQRPDALVRFDPKTEKFQSWAIPSGYGIIRHMTVSPEGKLLIHQSSSNRIGMVTIGGAR